MTQRGPPQVVERGHRQEQPGVCADVDLFCREPGPAGLSQLLFDFFFGRRRILCGLCEDLSAVDRNRKRGPVLRVGPCGGQLQRLSEPGGEVEGHRSGPGLFGIELFKAFQDGRGGGDIVFPASAEHVMAELPFEVSVGVAGPGKDGVEVAQERFIADAVHRVSAGRDCGGHVFRPLHAPFDLEGQDPGLIEFRNGFDRREVPKGQGVVGAASALRGKTQAAGLGTEPAVAAAAAHGGAEVTLTGDAHAERAVDEHLEFEAGVRGRLPNGTDLFERQFPGQDRAGEPEVCQGAEPFRCHDRHLGGGVELHVRRGGADEGGNAQVLDDECIDTERTCGLDEVDRQGQFLIGDQRVQGQVHFDAPYMAVFDCFRQFLFREVPGVSSGIEVAGAQIDGVGTTFHSSPKSVHAPRGGKDFRPSAHIRLAPLQESPSKRFGFCVFQFSLQTFDVPAGDFRFHLVAGGVFQILFDLTAKVVGGFRLLGRFVRVVEGRKDGGLGHGEATVGADDLGDVFVQRLGKGFDVCRIFFGENGVFTAGNVDDDVLFIHDDAPVRVCKNALLIRYSV